MVGRKSLGMSLLYRDNCPPAYLALGFANVNIPLGTETSWTRLWQQAVAEDVAKLEVGTYRILVGAHSLRNAKHSATSSQVQDTSMSRQLQRLQKTSSRDDRLVSTLIAIGGEHEQSLQEDVHPGGYDYTNTAPVVNFVQKPGLATDSHASSSKNGLKKWLVVPARGRRQRNIIPTKFAEAIVHAARINLQQPEAPVFNTDKLNEGILQRLLSSTAVQCECGSTHVADDMLVCQLCGNLQHKSCYGLDLIPANRLPLEHLCYGCLWDDQGEDMKWIVHMRLALLYLSSLETSTVEISPDFRDALFPEHEEADQVFEAVVARLIDQGFLSPCDGGFCQILPMDKARASIVWEKYVDNLAGVLQYYQPFRDGDSKQSRRNAILMAIKDRQVDTESAKRCQPQNYNKHKADYMQSTCSPRQLRRRISISNSFVNIDRSSSVTASGTSFEDATVDRVEWATRGSSRVNAAEGCVLPG